MMLQSPYKFLQLDEVPQAETAPPFATFDVALNASGWVTYQVNGWGFWFPLQGNDGAAALDLDLGGGGILTIVPGQRVRVPFSRLQIRVNSNSITSGTAKLMVFKRADVDVFSTQLRDTGSTYSQSVVAPNGAATQASNSAAGNVPISSSDGVALANVKALRVIVSAGAGNTLTIGTGEVRFWYYNATLGRWIRSDVYIAPDLTAASYRDWVSQDLTVLIPSSADRVYAEAKSITASAGSLTVTIQRYGGLIS